MPELRHTQPTVVERLAGVMITQNAEGGCTRDSLLAQGFTGDEIDRHRTEATILANERFVRRETLDPAMQRASRVTLAAALVLGLMPQEGQVLAVLRQNGFATREVGELWDDIIARAALDFRRHAAPGAGRRQPVTAATDDGARDSIESPPLDGMPDWGRRMIEVNAE